MKKIFLGADHAGFRLKERIKIWLEKENIPYEDVGNFYLDINDDYPLYAAKVARAVVKTKNPGLLFCGSAEGVCIAANKIKGIRAVNPAGMIQTRFAREHEDANILCLAGGGTRKRQPSVPLRKAKKMIKTFLGTKFSGAARHKRRLMEIKRLEKS